MSSALLALPIYLFTLIAMPPVASAQHDETGAVAQGRAHHVWVENGLSLGVDFLNDLPDFILDVRGLRAGIVDRNRAALELSYIPRVAYSFDTGITLGIYGGLGFTGPSTPQMAIMLDANGLSIERNRDKETGYALTVMGGTFIGLRGTLAGGKYLLPSIGVHWRGRQDDGLRSKLMLDLRFDTGFRLKDTTYLAIGPSVRMAAFSWGGLSHSGMRDISFNLVVTLSHALL